jgi:predicted dehydrogenase
VTGADARDALAIALAAAESARTGTPVRMGEVAE